MKKIFALLLVLFVMIGCASEEERSLVNKEVLSSQEKLDLLPYQNSLNHRKIIFDKSLLERADVKSYDVFMDIYDKGKKIDSVKVSSSFHVNSLDNFINYYNLDDCSKDNVCNLGLYIYDSEAAYVYKLHKATNIRKTNEYARQFTNDISKLEIGQKYIIESRLYYNDEQTDDLYLDYSVGAIEKEATKADSAIVVYVIFYDQERE